MKIDLHVHTRKTKQGDPESREVSAQRFAEVVLSTDVKIIAITNHNLFDLRQYEEILEQVDGAVQVWPGVELDVLEEGQRGHLIVVVDPARKDEFNACLNNLVGGVSPDDFSVAIEDIVEHFSVLDPIYVAHYLQKKPDISDDALARLVDLASSESRVIKEAANPISAGIFIAHGHRSIYGSDVQDWEHYSVQAATLPELRLPVDSFEQFCLLLDKDESTINTLMNRKESEQLVLTPFEDDTVVRLRPFNDINVIFGPKGTGKSKILDAIAAYYSGNGILASVFRSSPDTLTDEFDIRGRDIEVNLEPYEINYCTDEIKLIKQATEVDVTNLKDYERYFQYETKNKNAQKIVIKEIQTLSESDSSFKDFYASFIKVSQFVEFFSTDKPIGQVTEAQELADLIDRLSSLAEKLKQEAWAAFADWKSAQLTNGAAKCYRDETARKTGSMPKPTGTGFLQYAQNRLLIRQAAQEIGENICHQFEDDTVTVGSLGRDKGSLKCTTSFKFQDGSISDSRFNPVRSIKKGSIKTFARSIKDIESHAFSGRLFDCIRELNEIEDVESITTVYRLLMFWRRFTLDGDVYDPSTGECSMLSLQGELASEKDVYILDEPEKSLGNEYVNDVIVPLINQKAKAGKKVFIATHDANIAVRTLPYNSIYRCHDKSGYSTFVGNPFSNNLVNVDDSTSIMDWKRVSMKTLEGGEEAFGERGKVYGQN